jgi:hypothetical protein
MSLWSWILTSRLSPDKTVSLTCEMGIDIDQLFQLGPFFERFFNLGGPRGIRQKTLQN